MAHCDDLYQAIIDCDLATVQNLIATGLDVNNSPPILLHVAVIKEHQAITGAVILAGADINATDRSGNTALHLAAGNTNGEITKLLIANGANIEARDKYGNSPLHIATSIGHADVIEALLAAGADTGARNVNGATPHDLASVCAHQRSSATRSITASNTSFVERDRAKSDRTPKER